MALFDKQRNQPEWFWNEGYKKFFLLDEYGNIMTSAEEIFFAVDVEDHVIHKHGDKTNTELRYKEFKDKLAAAYKAKPDEIIKNMRDKMKLINVTKLPTDEINHALASSGYIGRLIKEYNLLEEVYTPDWEKEELVMHKCWECGTEYSYVKYEVCPQCGSHWLDNGRNKPEDASTGS